MATTIGNEDEEALLPNDSSNSQSSFYKKKLFGQVYSTNISTSLATLKLLSVRKDNLMNRKVKKIIFVCLIILSFMCILMLYANVQCPNYSMLCREKSTPLLTSFIHIPIFNGSPTFEELLARDFQFNIEGHDVMVFLHIQKTGGTGFGKHLVNDLELTRPCVCHRKVIKTCTCLRPGQNSKETWLFSRYSTGWKCGLHADWTELTGCVDSMMDTIDDINIKRRYFYITYLRDPIHRYQSEFMHVRRGATWRRTRLFCGSRPATEEEVPGCFPGKYWDDVTIEQFYSCKSNLANNRQTRMLANLTKVNCYNTSGQSQQYRDETMLESAKRNLDKMVFFGLTEFQEKSQYIFEETFNFNFSTRFYQANQTTADNSLAELNPAQIQRIRDVNHLDVKLYSYATDLFNKRYEKLKLLDTQFKSHFLNMGHMIFSWDDIDKER